MAQIRDVTLPGRLGANLLVPQLPVTYVHPEDEHVAEREPVA